MTDSIIPAELTAKNGDHTFLFPFDAVDFFETMFIQEDALLESFLDLTYRKTLPYSMVGRMKESLFAPVQEFMARFATATELTLKMDELALRQWLMNTNPSLLYLLIKPDHSLGLVSNVPEWFEQEDFVAWLNNPETNVMTWHQKCKDVDEYSDVLVLVSPDLSGEGSHQCDMPDHYWNQIIGMCKTHYGNRIASSFSSPITVRLTNLEV
ncbi:hypothetical protein [Neptuniibacter sp. QD37_11]|uniref:hypothetical protein n=1 Tax=Neptuniibacter sp. QD37_11 TaxID=3398209 RepID=UPI0039F61AD4